MCHREIRQQTSAELCRMTKGEHTEHGEIVPRAFWSVKKECLPAHITEAADKQRYNLRMLGKGSEWYGTSKSK